MTYAIYNKNSRIKDDFETISEAQDYIDEIRKKSKGAIKDYRTMELIRKWKTQ